MKYGLKLMLCMLCLLLVTARFPAKAESGGILSDTRFPDMALRIALDREYGDANHYVSFLRTEINVSGYGISDMTGIELFENLQKLDCSDNNIEGLNVDGCERLYFLDVSGNPLTVLNVAKSENLQILACGCENLSTLVLPTKYSTLKSLDISGSGITALDLSNYSALEIVRCTGGSLRSLDVTDCEALVTLYIQSPLSALNTAGCLSLEYIGVSGCALTSLSLSNLPSLQTLICDHNPMTALSLWECPLLDSVVCSDCQLTSISVSGCEALYDLNCANNRLAALDGIPSLMILDCSGNGMTALGAFPALFELNCSGNRLSALALPEGMQTLDCESNELTALDLSQMTDMTHLNCAHNMLTELNVSGLAELNTLHAHGNRLQSLDVGGTGLADVSWVGTAEYEGETVMQWMGLTFDAQTALLRGGEVIYAPAGEEAPLPTFFLPYGLQVIEEDAFAGIAAAAVLIPESVETIVGDPFVGSQVRYIYGHPGTAAEAFAQGRYIFVPIGESDEN